MKKLLTIILCSYFSTTVLAQEVSVNIDTPSVKQPVMPYRHEVGVETSAFFSQVFRLFGLVKDTQRFPVAPYILSYKYRLTKKGAIRAGFGMSFNKNTDRLGDFADSKIVSQNEYNARIGYETQNRIDQHWLVTLGGDVTAGRFSNVREFDSGFDQALRSIRTNSYGVAFVLGFRYDFSQRIGLGVETSLGFISSKTIEKDEFTANPQFNKQIRESKTNEAKFYLPANIFLSVRF